MNLGGGVNFYQYVGSSPVGRTDPFGLVSPDEEIVYYEGSDYDQQIRDRMDAFIDGVIPFGDPLASNYSDCPECAVSKAIGEWPRDVELAIASFGGARAAAAEGMISKACTKTFGRQSLLFGTRGVLNSNRYLRIERSRVGGNDVFRIAGDFVRLVKKDGHIIIRNLGPL